MPIGELSEHQTRKNLIDPMLERWGWEVLPYRGTIPRTGSVAIEEYPTAAGPADYLLCSGGQVIGIIEAKRLSRDPQGILTQAERYSIGLHDVEQSYGEFHAPFLYSTNGEIVWFHDIRNPLNLSRQIEHFHTPEALLEKLNANTTDAASSLSELGFSGLLRNYQIEAIKAVEGGIERSQRKMMLAMATGTGKTFTVVNMVYRLMKSGMAKRVLFLVDRRALAAQAMQAFASFEAEPGLKFNNIYEVYSQRFHRGDLGEGVTFDPSVLPCNYLLNPGPGQAFVYISTIQRMTGNLFGHGAMFSTGDDELDLDEPELIADIPIHAFDLIVADECHRGYTAEDLSVWRNTLDHFDAIKVGLTATPAAHTVAYFGLPIYTYEYTRAVQEGFLVDYQPVLVHSDVRLNGVFLKEGEQVDIIDRSSGRLSIDLLDDERDFNSSQVEREITVPDSNLRILMELKKYTDEHEMEYGRFPKTLVFAVNDLPYTSHSDVLTRLAREIWGRGESFVQKITGRVDRPLQRIREFRNRPNPGIVVSVDMLSTGVDIPNLEFIVLLRPVKSRILFEQMLGRGTRLGDLSPAKSHFKVFDCFGGSVLEYFANATGITAEPLRVKARTVKEIIEDIWNNRDQDYNVKCLGKRMQRVAREMSGDARVEFSRWISDGDLKTFAYELPDRVRSEFIPTMEILRDEEFQQLLVDYPKATQAGQIIAHGITDTVSSENVIKAGLKSYKPEDYLTAFMEFVRNNQEHIEAIQILHSKPSDWNPRALSELREKLRNAPEQFSLENLQKVHELHFHKALVDIISMTKHAVEDDEPLYTAEERVNRAFERVMAGKTFSTEQLQWLNWIRHHLVKNLSIDIEDFDLIPVLRDHGGWGRANRTFDRQLKKLLQELNEAVAA